MNKFKVGDKVIARKNAPYNITKDGWTGYVIHTHGDELIEVASTTFDGKVKPSGYAVLARYFDLVESPSENKKVVITVEDAVTTAKLIEGKKTVKEAVAKCSLLDEFNFETGVKLAVERLFTDTPTSSYKIDKREKYRIGDKVKIVDEWNEQTKENNQGKMNKWLGKIMTIISYGGENSYYMAEDKEENYGHGWQWNSFCIEGKVVESSEKKPPVKPIEVQSNLKVGTIVQGIGKVDEWDIDGKTGIIVEILYDADEITPIAYGVRFAEHIDGHDCDKKCPWGYGWICSANDLKVLDYTDNEHLVLMLNSPVSRHQKDIGYVCDLTPWRDVNGEHLFIGDQVDFGYIEDGYFKSHGRCVVSKNFVEETKGFVILKCKSYKELKAGDRFGYKEVISLSLKEDEQWHRYTEYLKKWAVDHSKSSCKGMCPVCFDEWCDNEDCCEE